MAFSTPPSTRIAIQAFRIEFLNPSIRSHPIYLRLFVDGVKVLQLDPLVNYQDLYWVVNPPINVASNSKVVLHVREDHAVRLWLEPLGSVELSSHHEWLCGGPPGTVKQLKIQVEDFYASVELFLAQDSLSRSTALGMAVDASASAQSILTRLGQARWAVEAIMALVETVSEIHPIAKASLIAVTKAYDHLQAQEAYDLNVRNLTSAMADMLSFVQLVNRHARIEPLKKALSDMLPLIEKASLFIVQYHARGAFVRAAQALATSETQSQVDEFIRLFQYHKENLDRAINNQILQMATNHEERNLILGLPRARSANYDPGRICMEGTRKTILTDISSWVSEIANPKSMLWLNGLAGAGKSSIAATICNQFEKQQLLGATFFCQRDDEPELRNPKRILPTLAARLSIIYPSFGKAAADSLRRDPDIGEMAIPLQYEGLFAIPIQRLAKGDFGPIMAWAPPLLIVIDALDECGSPDTRKPLIDCLLKLSTLPNWFKIIITSRPEFDIMRALQTAPTCKPYSLSLDDTATFDDIFLFTRVRMADIVSAKGLSPSWPGTDKTRQLAERASGLFIWAQTAFAFISAGSDPDHRLDLVLSGSPPSGAYAKLYALYETALMEKLGDEDDDDAENFRRIVGVIVTAMSPLTIDALAAILELHITSTTLPNMIRDLGSVLYTQQDSTIRVCHLSFIDFLTDKGRCPPRFYIDIQHHHAAVISSAFRIMQNRLTFNICGLETSNRFNDDILDLAERVNNKIYPPLRYSCVHWTSHFSEASKEEPLRTTLLTLLNSFFSQPLVLYWLEVLSLIGEVHNAVFGLLSVMNWIQEPQHTCSLVAGEVRRFVLAFREPITRSTPQLYLSALPFAPKGSLIAERFLSLFPCTLSIVSGREHLWSSCLHTSEGHTKAVNSVSCSPDGQRIVSSSDDHTIRIWDASTGASLFEICREHTDCVNSVAFSSDSRRIVSGSTDGTIRIWDADTGTALLEPFQGHGSPVLAVVFSRDDQRVVSGGGKPDNTLRIWNSYTGQLVTDPLSGHTDAVQSVAISPNGLTIASGSDDGTVRIWERGVTVVGPLKNDDRAIHGVSFSHDGTRIVSGSRNGVLIVRNSKTGSIILGPVQGHNHVIFSPRFSQDDCYIISGSAECTIRIWDAQTGTPVAELGRHNGPVLSLCFLPDGRHIASGSSDNTIRLWEFDVAKASLTSSETTARHTAFVMSVAFSPDGRLIASSSLDKTIRIWDAYTGSLVRGPMIGHAAGVCSVAFHPDGKYILSGSHDKTLRLWSISTGKQVSGPFTGHTRSVNSVALSRWGNLGVSGSNDTTVRLWDISTREQIAVLEGHTAKVRSVVFSPDGRLIASCSYDKTARFWDVGTRTMLFQPLQAHTDRIRSVAFSNDGNFLASGSDDNTIRIWNVSTGEEVLSHDSDKPAEIASVVFSRNDRYLIIGSAPTIEILDVAKGTTVCELAGHSHFVISLAVSPDGKYLVSGSQDNTLRLWNIEMDHRQESQFIPELQPDAKRLIRPVGPDGWIQRTTPDDPLLWVPIGYRNGLWYRSLISIPDNAVNRPITLDCTKFRHGSKWTEVRGSY